MRCNDDSAMNSLTQKNNVENKNFFLSNCWRPICKWQGTVTPVRMEHKHSRKKNKKVAWKRTKHKP
jgi:hypothetical protein